MTFDHSISKGVCNKCKEPIGIVWKQKDAIDYKLKNYGDNRAVEFKLNCPHCNAVFILTV